MTGPAVKKRAGRLEALPSLRFFAELHIVGFHFYSNTKNEVLNNFNAWGASPLSFFFLLSGFIFGYLFGGKSSTRKLEWWDFMSKRLAGLYPLYLASIIAGFLVLNTLQPHPVALFLMLLLSATKALPSAFENPISTPAWTVGAFLVLYAILPYCLPLLKSASPRVRAFVLPPFFWLLSMAEPAVKLGHNTGILHVYTRAIGICSVANFLQGLNLGMLFLEHDWTRHPILLQQGAASASLGCLLLVAWRVQLSSLPVFVRQWRDHGLLSPLHCTLIWYVARDRDVLCRLLKWRVLTFLGNISYGMYLFQSIVYSYLLTSSMVYSKEGFVPALVFVPCLIATSAFTVHVIQNNYTPIMYTYLKRQLHTYVIGQDTLLYRAGVVLVWVLETPLARGATLLGFVATYVLFVNYQGCKPIVCYWAWWSSFDVPSGLSDRMWFSHQDLHWAINTWALPCEKRSLLPASSPSLQRLISAMDITALLAFPALLLAYLCPLLPPCAPRTFRKPRRLQGPRIADGGPSLESAGHGTLPSDTEASLPPPTATRVHPDSSGQQQVERAGDVGPWQCPPPPRVYLRLLPTDAHVVSEEEVESQVTWYAQAFSPATAPRTEHQQEEKGSGEEEEKEEPKLREEEEGVAWRLLRRVESALRPFQARQSPSGRQGAEGVEVVVEVVGSYVPSDALLATLPPPLATTVTVAGNNGQEQHSRSTPSLNFPPSPLRLAFLPLPTSSRAFVDVVGGARSLSDARPGDTIIYLPFNARLSPSGLLDVHSTLLSPSSPCPPPPPPPPLLAPLHLDGHGSTAPSLYTLAHLCRTMTMTMTWQGPCLLATTQHHDAGLCPRRLCDALTAGLAPCPSYRRIAPMYRGSFHPTSLRDYVRTRLLTLTAAPLLPRLLLTSVELVCHVAFLLSDGVLLLAPVHEFYTPGQFQLSGSGYDCTNGRGWGVRPYRWIAGALAALYTGLYVRGFLSTFWARDGLVRLCLLLFLLLLALPAISLLESLLCLVAISRLVGAAVKSPTKPHPRLALPVTVTVAGR